MRALALLGVVFLSCGVAHAQQAEPAQPAPGVSVDPLEVPSYQLPPPVFPTRVTGGMGGNNGGLIYQGHIQVNAVGNDRNIQQSVLDVNAEGGSFSRINVGADLIPVRIYRTGTHDDVIDVTIHPVALDGHLTILPAPGASGNLSYGHLIYSAPVRVAHTRYFNGNRITFGLSGGPAAGVVCSTNSRCQALDPVASLRVGADLTGVIRVDDWNSLRLGASIATVGDMLNMSGAGGWQADGEIAFLHRAPDSTTTFLVGLALQGQQYFSPQVSDAASREGFEGSALVEAGITMPEGLPRPARAAPAGGATPAQ